MAAILKIPVDVLVQMREERKLLQQGDRQELLYPALTALPRAHRYQPTEAATSSTAMQKWLLSCCWVEHQCHLVSPLPFTPRNSLIYYMSLVMFDSDIDVWSRKTIFTMMQTLCVQSQRYLKTSLQHLITFQHKKNPRNNVCKHSSNCESFPQGLPLKFLLFSQDLCPAKGQRNTYRIPTNFIAQDFPARHTHASQLGQGRDPSQAHECYH